MKGEGGEEKKNEERRIEGEEVGEQNEEDEIRKREIRKE